MTTGVQYPVRTKVQEPRMPRSKKVGRLEVRVDKELLAALDKLQSIYGEDVTKSELVREAVIEKAERDGKKRSTKSGVANT